MNGGTISCHCHDRELCPGDAGLSRTAMESAGARNPLASPSNSFASALAIHSLGEHEELLPWLYRIVESMSAESSSRQNEEGNQRLVASILRTLFSRMPSEQVKVLEALELGSDSLEDTAARLHLSEAAIMQLHTAARANFITLLSGRAHSDAAPGVCAVPGTATLE